MKKLLLLFALLCGWPDAAFGTDVVISSQSLTQIPFNPSNLGNDRDITVTVTNGSPVVTSSAAFPTAIVGKAGFTVLISTRRYTVAAVATTSSLTLTEAFAGSTATTTMRLYKYALLRVYPTLGFQSSTLTSTTATVSVTNGSQAVTSSAAFNSMYIGVSGGFAVLINGVPHNVLWVASTSSLTLASPYQGSTGSATITFDGIAENIQPSTPGSGLWYKEIAISVYNPGTVNVAVFPPFIVPATTNGLITTQSRYVMGLYRPDGSFLVFYICGAQSQLAIQPYSPTTWVAICNFNAPGGVVPPNNEVYTKGQIDQRLPSCTTGKGVYFATTGNILSCLTFGTGLTLTGDVLTAAGGGGGVGPGTVDRIPRFNTTTTVADSIVGQIGTSELKFAATGKRVNLDTGSQVVVEFANAGSTGTTDNRLAKLTGAPSTAVVAGTSDTSGLIGVVVSGGGTSGSAQIVTTGVTPCEFDGATVAGDYVGSSTTLAGRCKDLGATLPSSNVQVIGRVLSTNVGAGTYSVYVFTGEQHPSSIAGSVTSVSFTGGIVSVANPTTTPAMTVAGTSGGVPYFSSASTWASSAALTANLPVIGGGAGAAPTVGTRSGNTTAFVTTTGAQTSGRCVEIDANGNHIASSGGCSGGLSGSGTANFLTRWASASVIENLPNSLSSSTGQTAFHDGTFTQFPSLAGADYRLLSVSGGSNSNTTFFATYADGNNDYTRLMLHKSRGSNTSPTAVQSGQALARIDFTGQTGTGISDIGIGARILTSATENWTAANNGGQIEFYTAKNSAGGLNLAGKIHNFGTWCLASNPTTVTAVNKLLVNNGLGFATDVYVSIQADSLDTTNTVLDLGIGNGSSSNYFIRGSELGITGTRRRIDPNGYYVTQLGRTTDYTKHSQIWKINSTSAGNTGTTETDLVTFTVLADSLRTTNDTLRMSGYGTTSSTVSNKQIRLYFGSNLILDTGALAITTTTWNVQVLITRTGAATQKVHARLTSTSGTLLAEAYTAATQTLANNNILRISGTDSVGSNNITLLFSQVEFLPAN